MLFIDLFWGIIEMLLWIFFLLLLEQMGMQKHSSFGGFHSSLEVHPIYDIFHFREPSKCEKGAS